MDIDKCRGTTCNPLKRLRDNEQHYEPAAKVQRMAFAIEEKTPIMLQKIDGNSELCMSLQTEHHFPQGLHHNTMSAEIVQTTESDCGQHWYERVSVTAGHIISPLRNKVFRDNEKEQPVYQNSIINLNPVCASAAGEQQPRGLRFPSHKDRDKRCPECAAGKSGHIRHIGRWRLMDSP